MASVGVVIAYGRRDGDTIAAVIDGEAGISLKKKKNSRRNLFICEHWVVCCTVCAAYITDKIYNSTFTEKVQVQYV